MFAGIGAAIGANRHRADVRKRRREASEAFQKFREANPYATYADFDDFLSREYGGDYFVRGALPGKDAVQRIAADNQKKKMEAEQTQQFAQIERQMQFTNRLSEMAKRMAVRARDGQELDTMLRQSFGEAPEQQQFYDANRGAIGDFNGLVRRAHIEQAQSDAGTLLPILERLTQADTPLTPQLLKQAYGEIGLDDNSPWAGITNEIIAGKYRVKQEQADRLRASDERARLRDERELYASAFAMLDEKVRQRATDIGRVTPTIIREIAQEVANRHPGTEVSRLIANMDQLQLGATSAAIGHRGATVRAQSQARVEGIDAQIAEREKRADRLAENSLGHAFAIENIYVQYDEAGEQALVDLERELTRLGKDPEGLSKGLIDVFRAAHKPVIDLREQRRQATTAGAATAPNPMSVADFDNTLIKVWDAAKINAEQYLTDAQQNAQGRKSTSDLAGAIDVLEEGIADLKAAKIRRTEQERRLLEYHALYGPSTDRTQQLQTLADIEDEYDTRVALLEAQVQKEKNRLHHETMADQAGKAYATLLRSLTDPIHRLTPQQSLTSRYEQFLQTLEELQTEHGMSNQMFDIHVRHAHQAILRAGLQIPGVTPTPPPPASVRGAIGPPDQPVPYIGGTSSAPGIARGAIIPHGQPSPGSTGGNSAGGI